MSSAHEPRWVCEFAAAPLLSVGGTTLLGVPEGGPSGCGLTMSDPGTSWGSGHRSESSQSTVRGVHVLAEVPSDSPRGGLAGRGLGAPDSEHRADAERLEELRLLEAA